MDIDPLNKISGKKSDSLLDSSFEDNTSKTEYSLLENGF